MQFSVRWQRECYCERGIACVGADLDAAAEPALRELQLAYRIGRVAGSGDWRLGVTGRNLHTWTNYSGIEPEASFLGGSRGGGSAQWEQNVTPQLAQFVTTLNLSF